MEYMKPGQSHQRVLSKFSPLTLWLSAFLIILYVLGSLCIHSVKGCCIWGKR